MRQRVVAVSLGADELLLLRAGRRGDSLRVEAVEALPLGGEGASADSVRERLRRDGFLGHPTVVAHPSARVFLHMHRPSVTGEAAVRRTIRYDVERDIPSDVESLVLDFAYLRNGVGPAERLVVAGAFRDEVEEELGRLREFGLEPTQVTVRAVAVGNACRVAPSERGGERLLALHFAPGGVDVVRLEGAALKEVRGVLARGSTAGSNGAVPCLVRPSLAEAAAGRIDVLRISGEAGPAGRAAERLAAELGTPVEMMRVNPELTNGLSDEGVGLLRGRALPLLGAAAEALGVAETTSLDLLEPRGRARAWAAHLRRPLLAAAALLIFLALLWCADGLAAAARASRRQSAAETELASLWARVEPGTPLPRDPVRALRARLSAGGGGAGGIGPLAALKCLRRLAAAAGEPGPALPYRKIRVVDGRVQVEGSLPDYAAVDSLLGRLSERGGFVVGAPEMVGEPGGVAFRVELTEVPDE